MLRRPPLEYLGVNSAAVSKHGPQHDWFPPFETPRCARLLRVRWCGVHGRGFNFTIMYLVLAQFGTGSV
jgi:hypothetical protein